MKITRENLKNIVREAMVEESAYQEFFKKALEKTGKSIPQMSDEEKKAFFNKIDSAWKGKGEKNEERFGRGAGVGPTFGSADKPEDEEEIDEEAAMVHRRTPSGTIVSKLKEENESVNEAEIKWGAVDNAIVKYIKQNLKVLEKPINARDEAGTKKMLKGFIDGLVNAQRSLNLNESVNEGTDIYLNKKIQITKFAGKNGQMVQINAPKYQTAGDHIVMTKDAFIQMLKNSSKLLNQLKEELEEAQSPAQKAAFEKMMAKNKKKDGDDKSESVDERMGSDKGEVGNANFNNRLKAMRDDKNSFVAFIDTNKGKKLLKVFKTQQTAKQFTKKNMDKLLNTKGVESVGTMSKAEWDKKEAKYAIK